MVRNDLFINVPNFFKCPISLDVMKSPVSLCTGVTYDRSSIQRWLDTGNNTCPATMQILHTKDFIPNLTLRRLINLWSHSHLTSPESDASPSPPTLSPQEITAFLNNIHNNRFDSLSKLVAFAEYSDDNRKLLANGDGFVPAMVAVLSNVDSLEIEVLESIVRVLDLIVSEPGLKEQLNRLMFKSNRDCLFPIVTILRNGTSNAKVASARVLEAIAFDAESKHIISEKQGLLSELCHQLNSETDHAANDAVLSTLTAVSTSRQTKTQLVRFGIVKTLGRLLSDSEISAEKALKLLSLVSTCTEGRTAISEDRNCVSAVVQRMMKVSSSATEHGVMVLWSVCYLVRDRTAQEAVMRSNGLTKILLVMQSNCSAGVRQMCGDLVKVFRVNSKSCLASYDTKTTHIMPY